MIKCKKIRATDQNHGHTEVYSGGKLLGYFMNNTSSIASKNENWNFVSKSNDVEYFHAKTKEELLTTITKQLLKEYVKLKQHFGIVTELNK